MREDALILVSLGDVNLTAYGLMMALAALLATGLTCLCGRKTHGVHRSLSVSLCGILGAVLGGHIVYVLTNIGMVLADYQSGISMLWRFNLGGYTLYGALLGGMAAIAIYGLAVKQKILPLLDLAVPGSLLALCIGRAAEAFTSQGLGEWLDESMEGLLRFPFAIPLTYDEEYVEWRVPVFVYEAAVALLLLLIVLLLLRKKQPAGRLTGTALTLIGTTQIFLEQIRQDDYVRFGFVRFTQIAAILIILVVLIIRVIRSARAAQWRPALTMRCAILVLAALIIIFVEFGVEKPQFLPYLRITMLVCAALVACWLIDGATLAFKANGRKGHLMAMSVISLIVVAGAVTGVYLLTRELEWENDLLMGIMAAALAIITAVLQVRTDEDRD